MRLLDTSTLAMVEIMGDDEKRYAILSHTWETDEVSFQEMTCALDPTDIRKANVVKSKAGYAKICNAAKVAAGQGFQHIWIDTCCIDKTSSAELSEAINSMYRWYKKAGVCIVYLADVGDVYDKNMDRAFTSWASGTGIDEFASSRWFTRGWTLQELIAPRSLRFYSKDWKHLADKDDISKKLSVITGIAERLLKSGHFISATRVAERMSWAAKRSTTRVEDMAYCLLGIFDVSMPLLYGEGERAFQRLQEEITKRSDDQSLFAWKHSLARHQVDQAFALYRGLFARSPNEFANFRGDDRFDMTSSTFTYPSTVTNIGLQTRLPLVPVLQAKALHTEPLVDTDDAENEYLALLNHRCRHVPDDEDRASPNLRDASEDPVFFGAQRYAIQVKKLIKEHPVYVRVRPDITYLVEEKGIEEAQLSELIIQQVPRLYEPHCSLRLAEFIVLWNIDFEVGDMVTVTRTYRQSPELVSPRSAIALDMRDAPLPKHGLAGTIAQPSSGSGASVILACGIDSQYSVPTVCLRYGTQPEAGSQSWSMAHEQQSALVHGPSNVLRLTQPGVNTTSASVINLHGDHEEFVLEAVVYLYKDRLICEVNVTSRGPILG